MIDYINVENILFVDIETVSGEKEYGSLSERMKFAWNHKAKSVLRKYDEVLTTEELEAAYVDKAGIFAEFGKIVCISAGFLVVKDGLETFRVKSFYGDDEKELLSNFADLVQKYFGNVNEHFLCGHNVREFDIPYIARRMVILGMKLPNAFNLAGKKPWETKHLLDTLELWKFGDFKNYTSLELLTAIFDIPSPKDDIDGSEVGRVYWQDEDLKRIAIYCEKDVVAVLQLVKRYRREPLLEEKNIRSASNLN